MVYGFSATIQLMDCCTETLMLLGLSAYTAYLDSFIHTHASCTEWLADVIPWCVTLSGCIC